MKMLILTLALFSSANAFALEGLVCAHPLHKSRELCYQAFEALKSRGATDGQAAWAVASCGYLIPSSVRSCLSGIISGN